MEESGSEAAVVDLKTEEDKCTSPPDIDPVFVSCLLQPPMAHHDPNYVATRRLLLYRKAHSLLQRKEKLCCLSKFHQETEELGKSNHSKPGKHSKSKDLRGFNLSSDHRSSFSSNDSGHQFQFVQAAYSFVGMHCIFDNCKASVTIVKFGHMSSDLLAYGASDGSLTICHVSEPPSVIQYLKGHSKAITDFDFSSNNQYIASSSVDKTVRVWEISKGHCIRVIYGTSSQLCIRFHPVNNNLLSVGNANKEISVINFSIGRVINKVYFDNGLTAMDNDHTGQLIFSGDAQGCIYTVSVNSHTGSISRSHKNRSMRSKSLITTVQYRTFSLVARCPVLLVCAQDGNICFFSVALEIKGYLTLLCSLKLAPRLHSIRASFCPLLSLEKGEFIVAGSEDSNVYFYDLTRPKHSCVNKLQGHGSPVIGVAWNYGENLLASSDLDGTVIVWKRAKTS
ncbi:Transcriptional corepressor LEUNIG [Platanthera zijinensis]|uniref:Transcriptional corepressor LEUNIG n=1 Tax=Platanthera zijinensis TaxID=2320716 RepID=A0AAP0AXS8_9ASPA